MHSSLAVVVNLVAIVVGVGFLPAGAVPREADEPAPAPTYGKDVAPFVKKYCVECHGGNRPKARVRLDEGYDGLMKAARKGQPLVKPSAPEDSVFLKCLSGSGYKTMPPKKYAAQPDKEDVEKVKKWIAAGAKQDP